MTSNIGSAAIAKGRTNSFGFFTDQDDSTSYAGMKALVTEELKGYFRPELLNRIDEIVVFRPLEKPQVWLLLCFSIYYVYFMLDIELHLNSHISRLYILLYNIRLCFDGRI